MAEPGPLRYAVLEVTNRCNLRCAHCASSSGRPRTNELALEEIRCLLGAIAALGGEEITIIGGEALLRDDWLTICRTVGEHGMRLLLITNGLLLARCQGNLAALQELRPHLIGISIDGATAASYRTVRGVDAFDEVVTLCHRLVADGHENVNAITTFWNRNLGEFDQFVQLFENTGITWQVQIANKGGDRFAEDQFLSVHDYAWLTERMREVLVSRRETVRLQPMDDFGYFPLDPALRFLHESWQGCIAGVELIGIRSNGDVLGCLSLGDDFVEANVRHHALARIWHADGLFRRFRDKATLLEGHCAQCPHARQCRTGCSAMAHSATGHVGCNPYCIRHLETTQILRDTLGM